MLLCVKWWILALLIPDRTNNDKTWSFRQNTQQRNQEISLTLIYRINEHLQHQVIFFVVCSNVSSGAMYKMLLSSTCSNNQIITIGKKRAHYGAAVVHSVVMFLQILVSLSIFLLNTTLSLVFISSVCLSLANITYSFMQHLEQFKVF